MLGKELLTADERLYAAIARVKSENGTVAGAGVLVTADQVLTCAHVVSDALGQDRDQNVAAGTTVVVDFPLADQADGRQVTAEVEQWIPEEPAHCGDVALLRLPGAVPGTRPLPPADTVDLSPRPVHMVGFPDDELGTLSHRGELSGKASGDWIQISRADGQTARVTGGFSGSPVWDKQRGAMVGIVVATQSNRDNTQQTFAISMRAVKRRLPDLDRALAPVVFRGLETFREIDEGIFFGRGDDITAVVEALKGDNPSVVLCGPSGCGKSSLARAGVLPEMRRQTYDPVVIDAGAGTPLLSALAITLFESARTGQYGDRRAESVDQVEHWLSDKGLVDTLDRLHGTVGGKYLVVLDQAEALLDRTEEQLEQAVELLSFQGGPGTRSRLLLTLRSDFMDAALRHPRLALLLGKSRTITLAPMTRDQLTDVITKPLEQAPAVAYDPGLAKRILDDACREPENLPLLGFVLKQLWDGQSAGRLLTTIYEAMHGVQGALAQHCDDAWKEVIEQDEKDSQEREETQAAASRLLSGLVKFLPGNKVPLRRRITREEASEAGWKLARSFAARRLLVLRGGKGEPETAELAHETLIDVWPALQRQIAQDEKFLQGRAELNHHHDRWKNGTAPLPGAVELDYAKTWLGEREEELTDEERDFLARARRRRQAKRTVARAGWIAAAVVLALIAALGTFLINQQRVSTDREAEGRSRSLATLSDELVSQDPGLAALVATAAYDLSPTQEARNVLLRRYDQFEDKTWALMAATESPIIQAATSTDGTVTLAITAVGSQYGGTGAPVLFVRGTDGRVQREHLRPDNEAHFPLVSRDGTRIAYLSNDQDGTLAWHEVRRDTPKGQRILGPAHYIRAADFTDEAPSNITMSQYRGRADFSPSGRKVVATTDGRARIWDLATERSQEIPAGLPTLEQAWFGPDEDTLVVQPRAEKKSENSAWAVDLSTGARRALAAGIAATDHVMAMRLSGNGGVLALCQEQPQDRPPVYKTVDVKDGRVMNSYQNDAPYASSNCSSALTIDEEGSRFALHEAGNDWTLVDSRPGGGAQPSMGPERAYEQHSLRLVGSREDPILVTWNEEMVAARSLSVGTIDADSPPKLLDRHGTAIVRLGEKGDRLALVRMSNGGSDGRTDDIIKEVRRPPRDTSNDPAVEPAAVQVNPTKTLAADVVGRNRVRVWSLPSLRQVADVTTVMPPADTDEQKHMVQVAFGEGNELVTLSGSRMEYWDASTGARLGKGADVRNLGFTDEDQPDFKMHPYPAAGHVRIAITGKPVMYVVDLRSGTEDKDRRVEFPAYIMHGTVDRSEQYAAVITKELMTELWSIGDKGKPEKVFGPMGPLNLYDRFVGGFMGDSSQFLLASRTSIRIEDAASPGSGTTYKFDEEQNFMDVTADGKAVLRVKESSRVNFLSFDPALWKRQLCRILGRDFTPDELSGLPKWTPAKVCPAG
ncbi:trypsin-like peptidase domain-containing protein [Streptomyces sp. PU_AKi4]|uniref:nSTAND1 domain-containing NTPase n=1 Tax=Streptomyces sp. PU_AKi4 TaxID=2800809 RepID=UPI003525ED36